VALADVDLSRAEPVKKLFPNVRSTYDPATMRVTNRKEPNRDLTRMFRKKYRLTRLQNSTAAHEPDVTRDRASCRSARRGGLASTRSM
jgi:hypothetical protein